MTKSQSHRSGQMWTPVLAALATCDACLGYPGESARPAEAIQHAFDQHARDMSRFVADFSDTVRHFLTAGQVPAENLIAS